MAFKILKFEIKFYLYYKWILNECKTYFVNASELFTKVFTATAN